MQIRILEDDGEKGMDGVGQHDDQFLKKIESTLLSQVKLQGIPNIKKVRGQACMAGQGCLMRFACQAGLKARIFQQAPLSAKGSGCASLHVYCYLCRGC